MKIHKVVITFAFLFAILVVAIILVNKPSSPILGYVIFEDGCDGSIDSEGYYELNTNLDCTGKNGIKLNSNHIVFDCQNFTLSGGLDTNKYGISVSANLTNTTLQNCQIIDFYDPIIVNENSNLNIADSSVTENNSCVTGDWTDLDGNSGCLATEEVISPTLTISKQTIYQNESLSYQINATSDSSIINYSIDDTTNFAINSSSGILTNATALTVANHTLTITVTDEETNTASESLTIEVLIISQTGTGEEETQEDEDDDSGGGGSSSSSDSSTSATEKICGEDNAWSCSPWEECENQEQKRTCEKIDLKCTDPLPETKRTCTSDESSATEICAPEWQCVWSDCVDGLRQATECFDLKGCKTGEPPTEESCQLDENVVITGSAVSALGRLKALKNPIKIIKNNVITFVIILLLVIGFVLNIVLSKKRKAGKKDKGKDEKEKLWDWEETH